MLASVGPAVLPANNNTTIIEIREEFNKIVSTLNRPVAARQTTEAGQGSLVLGGASKGWARFGHAMLIRQRGEHDSGSKSA